MKRPIWYRLLPDHTFEPVHEWGGPDEERIFDIAHRRVAKDDLDYAEVSTVFLVFDHNFSDGPPVLFETMVFGGPLEGECERYSTWDEAVAGHKAMVERVTRLGAAAFPELDL